MVLRSGHACRAKIRRTPRSTSCRPRWSKAGYLTASSRHWHPRGRHGHGDDRSNLSQSASHHGGPVQQGAVPRRIGRSKGGLNSKLHAVRDSAGKPLIWQLSERQVCDYRDASRVLAALPNAKVLIADKGYDSDWFSQALTGLGIEPCIPGRAGSQGTRPIRGADLQAAQPHRTNVR